MKVKTAIERLKKFNPEAELKMHSADGNNALFFEAYEKDERTVWLEDKTDCDLSEEIEARFIHALENDIDELDFFMELLDTGITLSDIREYAPERYVYSEKFCREHGLI